MAFEMHGWDQLNKVLITRFTYTKGYRNYCTTWFQKWFTLSPGYRYALFILRSIVDAVVKIFLLLLLVTNISATEIHGLTIPIAATICPIYVIILTIRICSSCVLQQTPYGNDPKSGLIPQRPSFHMDSIHYNKSSSIGTDGWVIESFIDILPVVNKHIPVISVPFFKIERKIGCIASGKLQDSKMISFLWFK